MVRRVYLGLGFLFLGVGIAGTFVPLLPATPFLLLAAGCFSKASERFHSYLINHPTFGPPIKNWKRSGAISRRAKTVAVISIMISTALVFMNDRIPTFGLVGYSIVICSVLAFILTRPHE